MCGGLGWRRVRRVDRVCVRVCACVSMCVAYPLGDKQVKNTLHQFKCMPPIFTLGGEGTTSDLKEARLHRLCTPHLWLRRCEHLMK